MAAHPHPYAQVRNCVQSIQRDGSRRHSAQM